MHPYDEFTRQRRGFFDVFFNPQTYKNLLYLLLSFPTGLFYFLFISIGLSLGGSLAVVLVGIPILMFVVIGMHSFIGFERQLARDMLEAHIIVPGEDTRPDDNTLTRSLRLLISPAWIKGTIYLFLKFPFGILGFVLAVVTFAMTFGFLLAPLLYTSNNIEVIGIQVDNLPTAMALGGVGLILVPFLLMISNQVAAIWRLLAETLLGEPGRLPAQPTYQDDHTGQGEKPKNDATDSGVYYDPYADRYVTASQQKRKNR